jgi:phosphoribosyl-AMP cyclohydrolase
MMQRGSFAEPPPMPSEPTTLFAPRGAPQEVENGLLFQPKFDGDGLIPAIVTDAVSGEVLMFAHMNAQALSLVVTTRIAHFWSRSRNALWKKGEQSGNVLSVVELRTDCDQDVVWMKVKIGGSGVACHTGARSCFYRSLPLGQLPSPELRLKRS